jgi:phosphatidylserine/phosphatidylglycerophosphate/cardiolipin synthase-like enzyme
LYRKTLIKFAAVALATSACAYGGAVSQHSVQPDALVTELSSPALRVLTEPAAGIGPIYLEKSHNTGAYDYLAAHGVHVRWAPAGTTYHQKTLTVDNATSAIMTLNLVAEDYPDTRDFAVIDTDHADVAAILTTFNADFAGTAITPPDGADLVWSPTNAQAAVLSVINGARRTLAVEDEEMDDPAVTSALVAAARRGVHVTITMTADSERLRGGHPLLSEVRAAPAGRVGRMVYGHRQRLQRLVRREQCLRGLQPALRGCHRQRRRVLAYLRDR